MRSNNICWIVTGLVEQYPFSSDGKKVALALPGAVVVKELASGESVEHLECNAYPTAVTFLALDDQPAVACGDEGDVIVGDEQAVRVSHGGRVYAMAASPLGGVLATGGENGARLWNLRTSELISTFASGKIVRSLLFSADGNYLYIGTERGLLVASTFGQSQSLVEGLDAPVVTLACGQDGQLYAATIRELLIGAETNAGTGKPLFTHRPLGPNIRDVAIHPGRNLLALAEADGCTISSLEGEAVKPLRSTFPSTVWRLAFTPDGSSMLVNFANGTVSGYDIDAS